MYGMVEGQDELSAPLNTQSVSKPARLAKTLTIIPIDEKDMRVARERRGMLRRKPFKGSANLVPRVLSYPPYVGRVGENPGNEVEAVQLMVQKRLLPVLKN